MPFHDEDDLIQRATRAFSRFCEANGYVMQQPSSYRSGVEDGIVRLFNVNGHLASYAITNTGRIRRIDEKIED